MPESVGDAELAMALIAGETDAFERFVERYRSKVFHYSWLMCGNPEDAEEVSQETLFNVFEHIHQLREPERIRPWVFRIARNVCLMQRRRELTAPHCTTSIDDLPPGPELDDTELPDAELLRSELRTVVDRIVMELPPLYRSVVVLRDFEELSTEDTAQILDVSIDVVKTRLHRARKAIRDKLDCYLHNHCLDDEPAPRPKPLTPEERHQLYDAWHAKVVVAR